MSESSDFISQDSGAWRLYSQITTIMSDEAKAQELKEKNVDQPSSFGHGFVILDALKRGNAIKNTVQEIAKDLSSEQLNHVKNALEESYPDRAARIGRLMAYTKDTGRGR